MSDAAYIITRGFQEGKALTNAQRSASGFAEEPVVLGRVLRRGSRPMRISGADYRANESKLLALEKAGSIKIQRPELKAAAPVKEEAVPCPKCGQVPNGQGGEAPCPACGLPTVHDPEVPVSGAGDTPQQEGAGTLIAAPPAEPPDVIVPPHPPPPPTPPPAPTEEPPPVPVDDPEATPAVASAEPAEPLDEGAPVSTLLPMQVSPKARRKRA